MLKLQKMTLGSFMTNVYFVIDGATKDCFVVDPADRFDLIAEKLASQGLKVKGILLTHAHFDHIMALEELRRSTGAPVMLMAEENETLTDPVKNLMDLYGNGTSCRGGDILLKDGDVITLGKNEIKVIHLPGHTPGSCAYIFDDCIISGDTLFREGFGRYDFPGGNYSQLRTSLYKLASLEGDYKVYPGHGAATTLEHERNFNVFLQ